MMLFVFFNSIHILSGEKKIIFFYGNINVLETSHLQPICQVVMKTKGRACLKIKKKRFYDFGV